MSHRHCRLVCSCHLLSAARKKHTQIQGSISARLCRRYLVPKAEKKHIIATEEEECRTTERKIIQHANGRPHKPKKNMNNGCVCRHSRHKMDRNSKAHAVDYEPTLDSCVSLHILFVVCSVRFFSFLLFYFSVFSYNQTERIAEQF